VDAERDLRAALSNLATLAAMTRLRFTTTETAIGPAGALVWEVGSAGAVVVIAATDRRSVVDVVAHDAVRLPTGDELAAPF